MGKMFPGDNDFILEQIFIKPADNEDGRKMLDKFEFGPDRTIRMWVTCPFRLPKIYNGEKVVWLV